VGRVDLDEMSVLAVIEAVDGVTDAGRCVVAERLCDGGAPCALHAAWSRARRELVGVLGGTTVASVAVVAP
jgi:DNA-binding IscR family transcriptional regulator